MSTITAQNIMDKAEIVLQDETNIRWDEDELLGWLNDAQRAIVAEKPDTNPTNESVSLDAGTKQSAPATAMAIIDVLRNMGTDGSTPGRALRLIPRRWLDEQKPDWHSESQVAEIQHWMFDERDPRRFYVYPPADGTTQVEILYGAAPSDITKTDTITLDDIYANSILDYMLYRAYLKDADYTANEARADRQYQAFLQGIRRKDQRETMDNPYIRDKVGAAVGTGG